MSNTRHAKPGSLPSDERFASDPLLSQGLKAGDVARRCEVLKAPVEIELAFFLQYISNLPGSFDQLAVDLLAAFPQRIGAPKMHEFGMKPGGIYGAEQVRQLRQERYSFLTINEYFPFPLRGEWEAALDNYSFFLSDDDDVAFSRRKAEALEESKQFPVSYPVESFAETCRVHFRQSAPGLFRQFCLDPNFDLDQTTLESFRDLPGALLAYLDLWEKKVLSGLVVTQIGKKVTEALDYAEEQKCLVLVEGFARTGKTYIAKAWAQARPGKRRIVSLSEATSDKEFFREIAKALGAAASHAFKANELRERVNDILRPGFLTLCLDEAHALWPTRNIREASPRRIEWVRMSLANYDVPVAMISTHQFTKAQQQIEKHTHWSSEQLIGRIAFCAKLPDRLERDDIEAVARFHLPEADSRSLKFLVNYVVASKKHLASIDHGVKAARHHARKEGRDRVTYEDIMLGFNNTVLPSDAALASAAQGASPGQKKGQSNGVAAPFHPLRTTISKAGPARDSGTDLTVSSDRRHERSTASLSPAET